MSFIKEDNSFSYDYQRKNILKSLAYLVGAIAITIGLYFTIFGIKNIYQAHATERTVVSSTEHRFTFPITDRRSDKRPVYRTNGDGKRVLSHYTTDYYVYYDNLVTGERHCRKSVGWGLYTSGRNVIVSYNFEKVFYKAKYPDKYKGSTPLNTELEEKRYNWLEVQ